MKSNREITICQIMLPSQANMAGNVHGGEIMKMMDNAAGAVAIKYARCNVVTARVDELQFLRPVLLGSMVTCTATIVYVGNTTMEVVVCTEVEDLESDIGPEIALTAYFTMVALDKSGKPRKLKPFEPITDEDKLLYADAIERRAIYKKRLK
jgi:acyl-CoA hydrolase